MSAGFLREEQASVGYGKTLVAGLSARLLMKEGFHGIMTHCRPTVSRIGYAPEARDAVILNMLMLTALSMATKIWLSFSRHVHLTAYSVKTGTLRKN
jgi:hypothetical protein